MRENLAAYLGMACVDVMALQPKDPFQVADERLSYSGHGRIPLSARFHGRLPKRSRAASRFDQEIEQTQVRTHV